MEQVSANILGTRIDALSWEQTLSQILSWACAHASRTVCLCNVHSVVSARHDPELAQALNSSDMNTPDGAPLAWLMRKTGWPEQQRLSGPDLMWLLLRELERRQMPVFLLGGTSTTLAALKHKLQLEFPALILAGRMSPPYRSLSESENADIADIVNASGARVLLVGLGCPKQEKWMALQRGKLHAVMLGVGAAFDYHAGLRQRAPASWQRLGLEWLHRLMQEPGRLITRYLLTNTLFLLALPRELWYRRRI